MLHKMIATAHLLGLNMKDTARKRLETDDPERGSYTVELVVVLGAIVLIAVAVLAIVRTGVMDRVNSIF